MFEVGTVVDRYEIEAQLGRGGMGVVYRAQDLRLRRAVALKVLESHLANEARVLLLREARVVAGLIHPNIVTVFDVGEVSGVTFMAMELVDGVPLRRHIGTPIPMIQAVRWLLDIARGLDEAHRAGVVHRDIKPGNIMITAAGAKILDFGVARPSTEVRGSRTAPLPALATTPGFSAGTPRYMAPEQLFGGPMGPAVDQFAWGLVAHELITGEHPRGDEWNGGGLGWSPPAMKDAPPEVAAIVKRALASFPNQRHASMGEIAKALEPHAGASTATIQFRAILPRATEEDTGAVTVRAAATAQAEAEKPVDFREPDRAFAKQLVDSALADIKRKVDSSFRSAVLLVTVDVQESSGRFHVQLIVLDQDDRLVVPAASVSTLLAAGELIGADARAGNGRWHQIVLRLGPRGLDPRGEIEVS